MQLIVQIKLLIPPALILDEFDAGLNQLIILV